MKTSRESGVGKKDFLLSPEAPAWEKLESLHPPRGEGGGDFCRKFLFSDGGTGTRSRWRRTWTTRRGRGARGGVSRIPLPCFAQEFSELVENLDALRNRGEDTAMCPASALLCSPFLRGGPGRRSREALQSLCGECFSLHLLNEWYTQPHARVFWLRSWEASRRHRETSPEQQYRFHV